MKLEKYAGNPILSPFPEHPWEDLAVFNPAAWYDEAPNTNAGSDWPGAETGSTSSV
jgi:hypothetical protein